MKAKDGPDTNEAGFSSYLYESGSQEENEGIAGHEFEFNDDFPKLN